MFQLHTVALVVKANSTSTPNQAFHLQPFTWNSQEDCHNWPRLSTFWWQQSSIWRVLVYKQTASFSFVGFQHHEVGSDLAVLAVKSGRCSQPPSYDECYTLTYLVCPRVRDIPVALTSSQRCGQSVYAITIPQKATHLVSTNSNGLVCVHYIFGLPVPDRLTQKYEDCASTYVTILLNGSKSSSQLLSPVCPKQP